MFNAVLGFLGENLSFGFEFIRDILTGGISLIYVPGVGEASGQLTDLGQLWLLTAIIGLGLWGLNYVRSMIPFTSMGKH